MATIKEALISASKSLKAANIPNPISEAQLLLAHALGKDKLYLLVHAEDALSDYDFDLFFSYVEKRVRHLPAAYILGYKEFMSLTFAVDERVLIPRPDTEILAEEAIRILRLSDKCPKALDLCCGSGCIGLSIAHYAPNADVTLSDLSEGALAVTQANANNLGLASRVNVLRSDLFEALSGVKFDLIVSNPPYISTTDIQTLETDVKDYEPYAALWGGEDGLDFYRKIIKQSKAHLTDNGIILLEIGYDQGKAVETLFLYNGYNEVEILKDYAGLDRVISAKVYI